MKAKIITLAFGHGLNDLIAGYFIGLFAWNTDDLLTTGFTITVYNILAFGGQYPIAILMKNFTHKKKLLVASYVLNVLAIAIFLFIPGLAIILAGIASAIYHVTGGTFCAASNKSANIGLFAAPGVAGLVAGGYFAWKELEIIPFLLPAAIFFLTGLIKTNFANMIPEKEDLRTENTNHVIDTHDIIMILLLLVISLRSATWNIFQMIHERNFEWLVAIAVAAMTGKIVGGWIADKIGWRMYALGSAILATPMLTIFKKELIVFCIGVGLLQSGIPATTSLLIHSLKGKTSVGIALSFGAAVIIGSLPLILPPNFLLNQTPYFLIVPVILLIFCNLWYKRITSHTD